MIVLQLTICVILLQPSTQRYSKIRFLRSIKIGPSGNTGPRLNIKTVFPGMGIPMLKIRRSQDRLIFNMGVPILVRQHLYVEIVPRFFSSAGISIKKY